MKSKPLFFNIQIPVKSYVKKFLESNYGNPVNFSKFPNESEFFNRLFKKKCYRNDSKILDSTISSLDSVEIQITEDFLYRYGWEMTKTNTVRFGKHYEIKVKMFMRIFVGISTDIGLPLNVSILKFQQLYDFSEDDWKYEAIKKDFYRHAPKHKLDFDTLISQRIENIIMANLYDTGTITHQLILLHERNSKKQKQPWRIP